MATLGQGVQMYVPPLTSRLLQTHLLSDPVSAIASRGSVLFLLG